MEGGESGTKKETLYTFVLPNQEGRSTKVKRSRKGGLGPAPELETGVR